MLFKAIPLKVATRSTKLEDQQHRHRIHRIMPRQLKIDQMLPQLDRTGRSYAVGMECFSNRRQGRHTRF